MADMRDYIRTTLLDPLQYYPTVIQNTMIELIVEMLEELYEYTVAFPEIVSPDKSRLDILKTIADQFLFTIRDDGKLDEQVDILSNILEVYNKRGSIDTIEHMWKYYGGDLPRDVQVIIPSYSIFKYNVSKFSGTHVFEDSVVNRTGVYEIKLTNSNYPIPELKEFLVSELVAAGNYIYFSNAISLDVTKEASAYAYKYDVYPEHLLDIQMRVAPSYQGMNLSGPSSLALSGSYNNIRYQYQLLTEEQKESGDYDEIIRLYNLLAKPDISTIWSGKENIFIDITNIIDAKVNFDYLVDPLGFFYAKYPSLGIIDECTKVDETLNMILENTVYCTPSESSISIMRDLYNDQGEHVVERKYFILAESLLGESLGYEPA